MVLSTITKKWEIESASRPLNDFGDFRQSQFGDMMLSRKYVQEYNEKIKEKMKRRSPSFKLSMVDSIGDLILIFGLNLSIGSPYYQWGRI